MNNQFLGKYTTSRAKTTRTANEVTKDRMSSRETGSTLSPNSKIFTRVKTRSVPQIKTLGVIVFCILCFLATAFMVLLAAILVFAHLNIGYMSVQNMAMLTSVVEISTMFCIVTFLGYRLFAILTRKNVTDKSNRGES